MLNRPLMGVLAKGRAALGSRRRRHHRRSRCRRSQTRRTKDPPETRRPRQARDPRQGRRLQPFQSQTTALGMGPPAAENGIHPNRPKPRASQTTARHHSPPRRLTRHATGEVQIQNAQKRSAPRRNEDRPHRKTPPRRFPQTRQMEQATTSRKPDNTTVKHLLATS